MLITHKYLRPLKYLTISSALFFYELYYGHISLAAYWILDKQTFLLPEIFIFFTINLFFLLREAFKTSASKARLGKGYSQFYQDRIEKITRKYHNISQALTNSSESERIRLARELHDDTIQQIILLSQKVELMKFDHPDNILFKQLDELSILVNDTIDSTRDFIRELRPPQLKKLGLVKALTTLALQKSISPDMTINFSIEGNIYKLREEIEMTIYRLSQTALQNIALHSKATKASLVLTFQEDGIMLSITDNGKGFDVPSEEHLLQKRSFGLLGMRERTYMCGGIFIIHSVIDTGTHIIIKMPKTGNERSGKRRSSDRP
jgi:signal transduction histidine kinase